MAQKSKPSRPPACRAVGSHCQELQVTLRVAHGESGPASSDAEATWLLGHTQRLSFSNLRSQNTELLAEAVLSIPCRHAAFEPGSIRCGAHGFGGPRPAPLHRTEERRLGGGRFQYVRSGKLVTGPLARSAAKRRALPVVAANPCATARCRTADQTIGAACCRDLQIEILCSPQSHHLESLIRHRKSPYLCKVDRESPDSLGAEVISGCAYLEDDGVGCDLHDRVRSNGSPAKPDLCFEWPEGSTVFHTACVFAPQVKAPK